VSGRQGGYNVASRLANDGKYEGVQIKTRLGKARNIYPARLLILWPSWVVAHTGKCFRYTPSRKRRGNNRRKCVKLKEAAHLNIIYYQNTALSSPQSQKSPSPLLYFFSPKLFLRRGDKSNAVSRRSTGPTPPPTDEIARISNQRLMPRPF
jgi:hypothetical protein